MMILLVILILVWLFTMASSHKKIQKLEAEIAARRAYDNERNLRILWANERDTCDEAGDADSFYETYGKNVSRLELDLEADLGSIERSGQGFFGLTRTQEQIQKGRKLMEERGKRLRETCRANQAAIQATKEAEALEYEKSYQRKIEEEAEENKRYSAFLEVMDDAPDEFSATLILTDYLAKLNFESYSAFVSYLNKINPELSESLRKKWWEDRKKLQAHKQ